MRSCAVALLVGILLLAQGAYISFNGTGTGVYSTGFSITGNVLSGGAVDAHYALISLPAGCTGVACQESSTPGDLFGPAAYVVLAPTPSGRLATSTDSQWIGPRADQTNPAVGGSTFPDAEIFGSDTTPYVYRSVFNLTGFGILPSTANIQLAWSSDDPSAALLESHIRMCGIQSIASAVCGDGFTVAGSANGWPGGLTAVIICRRRGAMCPLAGRCRSRVRRRCWEWDWQWWRTGCGAGRGCPVSLALARRRRGRLGGDERGDGAGVLAGRE